MLVFHPLANLFPLIEGDEFDALVADLKANGLRDQIVMLGGKVLDGRNRYRAGLMAEVVPADGGGNCFRDFSPATDGDPLAYVLSKNLSRRHLNESQRAMVAARIANMPSHRPGADKSANLPTSQPQAANQLNVSARLVRSAKAVQDTGTENLNKAVDAGKLPASTAAQAAKLPVEQQDKIAAMAEAGKANPVRTVIKQDLRDAKEKALGAKQQALPDKKYGVILMDPEWQFQVWSRETGLDRSADNHYPTSDQRMLLMREIHKIAAKDSMCAMWVTDLAQGIRLMQAYGFTYKSYFVWVKDIVPLAGVPGGYETVGPAGTGYWNRDRDELLLIGTRGEFPAPAPGTQGESVWFAARGKHSEKPENAHLWIERHWPSLPKIELNARARRKGWDAWGNEAPAAPEPEDENQDRHEVEFNQESRANAEDFADGRIATAEDDPAGRLADGRTSAGSASLTDAPVNADCSQGVTGGESAATVATDSLLEKSPRWQMAIKSPAPEMEIPSFLLRKKPEAS